MREIRRIREVETRFDFNPNARIVVATNTTLREDIDPNKRIPISSSTREEEIFVDPNKRVPMN